MPLNTDLVVTGGHVLSMDPAVPDGPADVVVRDGVIVSVGPAAEISPRARVVDAAGCVVLPGLVDTHRHTWQSALRHIGLDWSLTDYLGAAFLGLGPNFRPEDVYAGTLVGALGALECGITTLVDWSHIQNTPAHGDAAVAALRDSGIRGVFAYGWPQTDALSWVGEHSDAELPADVRRIRDVLHDDGARVTMALAARGPEMSAPSATRRDLLLARELGLRVTMHVGRAGSVDRLHGEGLLDETVTLVHASAVGDDELKLAADAGTTASVAPFIEMTMPGLGSPATGRLLRAGVVTGLGADTEIATSGDMFTQMRAALAHHRFTGDGAPLTAGRLLRMATADGAAVAGLGAVTGSLTPGKRADLVVVDAGTPATAPVLDHLASVVLAAHPGLVRTVVCDGVLVKHDGVLTGPVARAGEVAAESLAHLRHAVPGLL
ncbi:amidohydrolase family protein [Microbispora amethystogenes]|uniref:amidohydrolase family protein n=1 Tax=Microbispora amethystogenes TaxID=1427754 RepID=UPI0033FDD3F7